MTKLGSYGIMSSNTLPGFALPLLPSRLEGCNAIVLESMVIRSVVTHSMVAMLTMKQPSKCLG